MGGPTPTPVAEGGATNGALPPNRLATVLTAIGVVVTAVAALGGLLGWLEWSNGQWIVVGAAVGSFLSAIVAGVAHFRSTTRGEPVALGASVTALATAIAALGGAFDWWTAQPDVKAAVVGLVTAVFGLLTAIFARSNVKPVQLEPK